MMGRGDGSMMSGMVDLEQPRMMRDPAMRRMHVPQMQSIMREHMGG